MSDTMVSGTPDEDAVEAFNEEIREDWIADTTGFERVKAVLKQTREPTGASAIAETAGVSPKTARKYLGWLVDLGVAERVEAGNGARYRRSEEWRVAREVMLLRRRSTLDAIRESVERMTDEIRGYREEYGVETPDELLAALDAEDGREVREAVAEWRATAWNLAIAKTALQFEEAVATIGDDEPDADPVAHDAGS